MEPGDVQAFEKAIDALGKHQGNFLLHYILAISKYPTALKILLTNFQTLVVGFNAKQLKVKCHQAICTFAAVNNTAQVQRELVIYDDQRECTCSGFTQTMIRMGLLKKFTPGSGGKKVTLGRGQPLQKYCLTYNKQKLRRLVAMLGSKTIKVSDLQKGGLAKVWFGSLNSIGHFGTTFFGKQLHHPTLFSDLLVHSTLF